MNRARPGAGLKAHRSRTDAPWVEDGLHTVRAELRRRTRRLGLVSFASAPIFGILIALLSRPRYGVFLGAILLELGLYVRFAYLPFAAWLRRRELSR
jgi:hypothetical protein